MQKSLNIHLIILLILFLGSCVPGKELSYERLEPAGINLPYHGDSLLVLNLSYLPWVDTGSFNLLRNLNPKEAYIVDTIINQVIFDGLFSILDESEIELLRNSKYMEFRGINRENFLQALDTESVNQLCIDGGANLIISLEYYGMDMNSSNYGDEFGIYFLQSIDRKLIWRIYMKESGMIEEFTERDTIYWEGSGYSVAEAQRNMPSLIEMVRECFWLAGEEFGQKISPVWTEVNRSVFPIYRNFKEISTDTEQLQKLATGNRRIRAYKALYNLAIEYEREGKPEDALKSLSKALGIRPKASMATEYKQILEKAVLNKNRLDLQLMEKD